MLSWRGPATLAQYWIRVITMIGPLHLVSSGPCPSTAHRPHRYQLALGCPIWPANAPVTSHDDPGTPGLVRRHNPAGKVFEKNSSAGLCFSSSASFSSALGVVLASADVP
ncbi:hypothetical protein B0H66DRAFT_15488 [Apodospora peruviana]|uniref:Secreted protein n=1 Tax=Apodospora peruviana TaxID=516989 RepID=A0AAE0IQB7_9PEZI|nr:hypothetical protein B0H66DRAFT_15488 [Apodospora peruviana]